MIDKARPILSGYMILEEWAEDYSDWSGAITGPVNPRGANLAWTDPIPMIETRAHDKVKRQRDILYHCLSHALAIDYFNPSGSTEGWAKDAIAEVDKIEKEEGLDP